MKTKICLFCFGFSIDELLYTCGLLLLLAAPPAKGQMLSDMQVPLKQGDIYYMDYQTSFIVRHPAGKGLSIKTDTQANITMLLRLEVAHQLKDGDFLVKLTNERVSSHFQLEDAYAIQDSKYQHPFSPKGINNVINFNRIGVLLSQLLRGSPSAKDPDIQNMSWVKIGKNLIIKREYLSEADALVDIGKTPQWERHLWLDFDKIGIYVAPENINYFDYFHPSWNKEALVKTSSTAYLDEYQASYLHRFQVDKKTGWLRFAQFDQQEKKRNIFTSTTIKAWKGSPDKKTIVEGYLQQVPDGLLRKENLKQKVPFYFDKGRANIQLAKNGYFRWEGILDKPAYFSLSTLKGDNVKEIYCYIQPGDSLYVQGDFLQLENTLTFGGQNKIANTYLNKNDGLPLPGLSTWFGMLTVDLKYGEDDKINALVEANRQDALDKLEKAKAELDPIFYKDEYWRLRYSTSQFLRMNKTKALNLDKKDFLPIANREAEHLPAYWSYLEYAINQAVAKGNFGGVPRQSAHFNERYNSAKSLLGGYPQHIVMYHALWEAMHYYKVMPGWIMEEFLAYCEDDKLTKPLLDVYRTLLRMEPNEIFPDFHLKDTLGELVSKQSWRGKKVVLMPSFHIFRFNKEQRQKREAKYPNLSFVYLALYEAPADFTSYKKQKDVLELAPNANYLFPKDKFELAKIQQYLGIDTLHQNSGFSKVFFLDEAGKIAKQSTYYLDQSLEDFAQQPSVILPIWKNPIWKIAIPIGLLIGLLTWGIVGFVGSLKRKKLERQRKMVEMEINAIRSQLNPHFVFNTMSSIQNLILSDRTEQASQYLAELAGLMRAVLRQTKKGIISLEEELNTIRQYCKLEALRKAFSWNIQVAENVDIHHTDIPAMLLQPYVENAILHGFRSKEVDGKIDLIIERKNGSLAIFIKDNGIGIQQASLNIKGGNHLGLQLNRERLKLLYGDKAKVLVKDRMTLGAKTSGTQVAINIPV
ncbi:MAG: histidine kinase [Saprospiraceae bacterium]